MRIICFALCLLTITIARAQTTISGRVADQKGEHIIGANVYLKDTYDGASSLQDGSFKFITTEVGEHILVVSMIGYQPQEQTIVCKGEKLHVNFRLREKIDEMHAVTITAGAMEASDAKKAVVMKPLDIVTTSGALGDVVGALNKLPGTATIGNDGRLFVRGGDASETNIYFDGMQVGSAFGTTAPNVPTRTRFNPSLFKGSFFSTGGYSAEYGQALSSALVLNSIDMPLRNQTDISLMSVGGSVSHTQVGENNAVTAAANYTNLQPYQKLIPQNITWYKAPRNWSAEVLARQKYGKSGLLKAYLHTEQGNLSIGQPVPGTTSIERIDVDNRYHFANLNFRQPLNSTWSVSGGFAYAINRDHFQLESLEVISKSDLGHLKIVVQKDFSDRLSFKNGLEWYNSLYNEHVNEAFQAQLVDHIFNHFIEADLYFNSSLVGRAGLRTTYNQYTDKIWTTPRLSLALKTSERSQLSVAFGEFRQLPGNEIRIQQENLQNTRATHFIANYLHSHEGRTFRIEAFNKLYNDIIRFDSFQNGQYFGLNNKGSGYSRGMDIFYRDNKSLKNTDFWITYSLIDSKRNYLNFQNRVTPNFAPRHNVSLVAKHFVTHLNSQLGTSFSWHDGQTYHNPNLPGEMQGKTSDYSNLSFSWSYLPQPNLIIHFECSNVLGSDNIFGYRFAESKNENGIFASLPIRQTADRFIFLGVFLTLSRDKNANQLNNL